MRTQGCRWPVVVFLLFPAFFFLQACGSSSSSGGNSGGTVPSIVSISPTSVAAGATGLTLTVTGTNFLSGATVRWNGASLSTTRVSATELTATVAASQLATGATVTITVVNPGSSGGTSSGVAFAVNNPVPVVTDLAPSQAPSGSSAFQLTVDGFGFSNGSQVRWNGTALTTTYVSGTRLTASVPAANLVSVGAANITVFNASPGGGTSTALVFTIGSAQSGSPNHITSLSMIATGMVWDASRGRIYAALPATSASGNSVVAIDPVTGATTTPVFVGSDPNLLALSPDASFLWVSLDGANAIQRVTLPSMTPNTRINLPPHSSFGPQVALAMQAAPVNRDTLAVILGKYGWSPSDLGGVAIYDGAVPRPTTIPGSNPDMTWLQWGPDDGTLYGQNGETTGFDLYAMNVDASGVRMGTEYSYIFPDFDSRSYYDRSTGLIYADDGRAFNPTTGVLAGTFNLRDFYTYACLPDPVEPVVFFLGRDESQRYSNSGYTLRSFDKNTYRQLGNLRIPDATGSPVNLIRWGRAGVAFNTVPDYSSDTGAVYFVDGPFVNSSAEPDFTGGTAAEALPVFTAIAPESATVGGVDLVLTITGSQFQPTATVYWQGQALATTYHSSTELQAVVPASRLAQEASAVVSVANDTSSYAVNSLAFTILPPSGGTIVRNLSSLDIAWDAHGSRLYAPVWSADPRYPNSIVAIDPASGSISKLAGVAPDPDILRISRDGTLGYAGFMDANLVTQFHVPALDSLMSWCLGLGSYDGPHAAVDIQPAPESAQTTAVAFGPPGWSPEGQNLAIFDNAVARPQRPPSWGSAANLYDTLQWGLTDSTLYAADYESSGFELSTLGVNANGATLLRTDHGVLSDYGLMIHFDRGTGYLYADDGYATDPATGSHVGRYNASGLLVPDSSLNRVFVLGQTSSQYGGGDYTMVAFDQAHFTPVSSLTIRNLVGYPVAITRWGTSGLAIVTYNWDAGPTSGPAGMLYILDNPTFFSATQQVQAGVENLAVGLTWQPGRSAFSTSRRSPRSAESAGRVFHPSLNRGTNVPKGRRGPSR